MLLLAAMLAASAPAAEQAAIFKAAGFARHGTEWKTGFCDGMETASYDSGRIDTYRDLNGDGRPEAIVTEGGAICYGNTGMHFWLLSKQASGSWKPVIDALAMPKILSTTGVGGWPDIYMGGPGLCRTVVRWNGEAYVHNRWESEGKPCEPSH